MAGALSLEEAVRLVCCRGQVMQKATGLGKMAAVALSAEEAAQALRGYEGRLAIAAVNDPGSVVLSGDSRALAEVMEGLQQRGVHCRMLRVDYAFHSPQMAPFQAELRNALGRIEVRRAAHSMYSTVTGARVEGEALDTGYWARNLREPVQLAGALGAAIRDGYRLFVEVGPHPVLTSNVQECLQASPEEGHVLPTLRRGQEERPCLLQALGGLYAHGAAVEWTRLYPQGGRVVSLPTYPWQRQRYWVEAKGRGRVAEGSVDSGHPLLGMQVPAAGAGAVFEAELGVEAAPYLAEHRVFDEVIAPGAALLELAHAGAVAHLGTARVEVTGLVVQAPLVVPERGGVRVQVVLEETSAAGTAVTVYSQGAGAKAGEPWTVHAQGYVQPAADQREPARVNLAGLLARCRTRVSVAERYGAFAEAGLTYGPAFQGMVELWQGEGEAVTRLSLPSAAAGSEDGYGLHPALLDAALQGLGVALGGGATAEVYLPFEVTSYRLWQPGVREAWVHARRVESAGAGTEVVSGDLTVVDGEGNVLAEVTGLRLKRATAAALRREKGASGAEWLIGLSWNEAALASGVEEGNEPGRWLVLTDGSALGQGLVERLRAHGGSCVTVARGAETARRDEQAWVVEPGSPQALGRVLAEMEAGPGPVRGVVCLWAAEPSADAAEASTADAAEAVAVTGLHVVQALAGRAAASPPRLWWVTQGAQAVGAGEPVDVAQAPLWGLGRVVMQEHPEMRCTLVDLEPGVEDAAEALWREVRHGDDETQVAWRQGKRHVARLVRAAAADPKDVAPLQLAPASTVLITGGLGALGLHVARWLVEQHQVRHVVLVGRRAAEG
ncbi:MAG TPA: polyketide synthase dehydratase domain-containing protein, partial [Burkholderiales bacterium]